MTEAVEEMTMTAVKIIILLIGIVFLFIIFTGIVESAYEQIAFANTEKLRSAINEACFKGATAANPIEIEFELPQKLPPQIPVLEEVLYEQLIGEFIIRPSGDPSYVLYYEMFPPGEAIGWELYHDFGYRAIGMLPEGATLPTASSFLASLRTEAAGRLGTDLKDKSLDVFIGNIELTGGFDPLTGEPTEKGYGEFFGIGEWEDDNFIFDNYLALSPMNKTIPKYQPCGDNSLCLKTTKGVYSYPLKYCTDRDYVQVINTNEAKYSDFYLASPCESEGNIRIFLDDCKNSYETVPGCEEATTYPIYRYNNNNLEKIGDHTTCLDTITDEDVPDISLPCVRVVFYNKEGFCHTSNIISVIPRTNPVPDLTEYITNNKFILDPKEVPSFWKRAEPGEIWIWP